MVSSTEYILSASRSRLWRLVNRQIDPGSNLTAKTENRSERQPPNGNTTCIRCGVMYTIPTFINEDFTHFEPVIQAAGFVGRIPVTVSA